MTTRETISLGSVANDGTGDTLRAAGTKINNNFEKVFQPHEFEVLTSSGAASLTSGYTVFNSGSALAITLADATDVGTTKTFTNKGAGSVTVTPTNFGQGTSFVLAQYVGCSAIWDGTDWYLTGAYPDSDLTIA